MAHAEQVSAGWWVTAATLWVGSGLFGREGSLRTLRRAQPNQKDRAKDLWDAAAMRSVDLWRAQWV